MKKVFTIAFIFVIGFTLVACSTSSKSTSSSDENNNQTKTEEKNSADIENEGDNQTKQDTTGKKILIAYFSHSGNTQVIANQIHEKVGGDIFEIKTVDPYPDDYDEVVNKAKQEQEENYRPKLASKVDNMDSYDTIFVGYPNWWGTMPMALFTFLEEYNFSGKIIIPFCTHEGSALGKSVDDIKKICNQSTVCDGLAIRGSNVYDAKEDVSKWLQELGMSN